MKKQKITYGRFTNDEWTTINGLGSIENLLHRIKTEIDWKGYQLWIHGSILSDVDTHDVDLTIMGPTIPQRINSLLEAVVKIGFEEKIFCDVKYNITNELYDPKRDSVKTIRYACYQSSIQFEDQVFDYGELVGELHLKEYRWPLAKTIRNGYDYKSPLRLI